MSLEEQYATILLMVFSGALMGMVHDFYRTVLKEWRFLRKFSVFFDVLYWVFAIVFVFTVLLGANHGDVRLVVFVLLAAGWWVYALTLRKLLVPSVRQLVRFILFVLHWIMKLLWWVLIAPVILLLRFLRQILSVADKITQRVEKILIWPINFTVRKLFYRFLKKEDGDGKTNQ